MPRQSLQLENVAESPVNTVQAAVDAGDAVPAGATPELWLSFAVVPAAAVLIAVLAATGVLSGDALRRAPARRVGLRWWDALVGLWLWFCGSLIGGAVAGVWAELTREDAKPIVDATQPWLVMLLQVASFGPPVAWLLWRTASARGGKTPGWRRGWVRAGVLPRNLWRDLAVTLVALPAAVLLVMAVQSVAYVIATQFGEAPPAVQHDFLNAYTELRDNGDVASLWMLGVSTVVFAPLFEELFNRGLLQTSLLSWLGRGRRWLVIGGVSVFFALLHVGAVPWVALPALILLGVVFGWLYERTGSLWPAILVHAAFNGLNVAYVLLAF